jgi:DNA-binding NtrC family response regulator
LIVDDDPLIRQSLREWLEHEGYLTLEAGDGKTALDLLDEEAIDVLLLDLKLPRVSGMDVLRRVAERHLDIPVVIVSGRGTIPTAVETMKLGAFHFIEKPPDAQETLRTIRLALAGVRRERERTRSLSEAMARYGMVGATPVMQEIYRKVDRAARTRARVLLLGESGAGKDHVARAIHRLSGRSAGPFVAVNCAAIPASLIESELFGHVRGAYTDARRSRKGRFLEAGGGTLFLDEVADMSLMTQSKILRAIEEEEVRAVGSDHTVRVNVRLITATNKDLRREIEEGNLREDLFFRLNVIPITVPSLRERLDDLPALVRHFVERSCAEHGTSGRDLSPAALGVLLEHDWPGNVRELRNVIERLVVMSEAERIGAQEVRDAVQPDEDEIHRTEEAQRSLREARAEFERAYIKKSLVAHGWRIKETALALGIDRSHLWRKARQLGIETPEA